MDEDATEWIVADPHILSGKPVINGTRIPVSLALNLLAHGYDFDRIAEVYPNLSKDAIRAAFTWGKTTRRCIAL
jgi:uncharacterized protein (DUF433 family)